MPGFKDFIGTPYLPALLPVIPHGAQLSSVTNLTPDRIGKIPGLRVPDGWKGFEGWTRNTFRPEQAEAMQRWFDDRPCATIGIQAAGLPSVDSDADDEQVASIIHQNATAHLGAAPKRGRPNSHKFLMMYRLRDHSPPITKKRLTFVHPSVPDKVMAVELLGKGQHYIIEGEHPSGVMYEWDKTPLEWGYNTLTEIDNSTVGAFFNVTGAEPGRSSLCAAQFDEVG